MSGRLHGAAVAALLLIAGAVCARPPILPFDFSRGAIGLDVTVRGTPLHVILDTGVDPSVIDTARAEALGLTVDREAGGEATGGGDAKESRVFPTRIDGLAIGDRPVRPFEAVALDMKTLSDGYGRTLDGVLGYSFLVDRIVLIDYGGQRVALLDRAGEAGPLVRTCRTRWRTALRSFAGDRIPIIRTFRLGTALAPVSLDTGSNGGINLYQAALDLPGVRAALVVKADITYSGARGDAKAKAYALNAPVGFGPFALPAGETVTVRSDPGSVDTRVANVGNRLFAAMGLRILLDYRARTLTFFGDCR